MPGSNVPRRPRSKIPRRSRFRSGSRSRGSSSMLSNMSVTSRSSNSSARSEYRRRPRPSAPMSFRSMIYRIRNTGTRWPSPKTFARNTANFNYNQYKMYHQMRKAGGSHTFSLAAAKNKK